jgi:polyhydroxybutyrate depolymerase
MEFLVAGRQRRALLQLPPAPAGAPLVVMLHGAGGTAAVAEQQTGWSAKAVARGVAVLLPEGTPPDPSSPPSFRLNPQLWNDGSGRGHVARQGTDDVGFIMALVDRLIDQHALDHARVYLTGFSNGASLIFRIGAERPGRIAGIAPVAGHCWIEPGRLTPPVPLFHIAGDADPLNPPGGGEVATPWGHSEYHPPVRRSIERWSVAAGCSGLADHTDASGVHWTEGRGCGGAEVRLAMVPRLGHVWPGGPRLLPERVVGRGSSLLPATEEIAAFFERRGHPAA